MFSDWIIDLIDCGAITCAKKTLNRGKIVASFCMGTQKLYDYINNNPFFEFHPTEYVNDLNIIAQHDKMVAINVGLEIDLTGQVCADSLGYKFYSGIGGQVDFIRGAARSRGGKAIIAMPSTAKDGQVSRIVPHLTEGAGVVTTRGDVHYVVTEYGIAYLHGKSIRERALDLINIAHPKFRKDLIQAAKARNYIYQDQIELSWDQVNYPEELEHYDTLRDGTEIFFRPIKPMDEPALSEMLYSLSEQSVRTRYMTQTMAFPHKDVQQLTNIDYKHDLAIVGVVPGPGGEDIVAIAQYFLDPKTQAAEVAFLVQDEWQAKGMGTFLLDYITQVARQRGVKRFYAKVLADNQADAGDLPELRLSRSMSSSTAMSTTSRTRSRKKKNNRGDIVREKGRIHPLGRDREVPLSRGLSVQDGTSGAHPADPVHDGAALGRDDPRSSPDACAANGAQEVPFGPILARPEERPERQVGARCAAHGHRDAGLPDLSRDVRLRRAGRRRDARRRRDDPVRRRRISRSTRPAAITTPFPRRRPDSATSTITPWPAPSWPRRANASSIWMWTSTTGTA